MSIRSVVISRRQHSKTGCITCKVRKKRCSEEKPRCNDCDRLDLDCVYPDNLSKDQIKDCKVRLKSAIKSKRDKFIISDMGRMSEKHGGDGYMICSRFEAAIHDDGSSSNEDTGGKMVEMVEPMMDIDVDILLSNIKTPPETEGFDGLIEPEYTALHDEHMEVDVTGSRMFSSLEYHGNGSANANSDSDKVHERQQNLVRLQRVHNPDPYMSHPLPDPIIEEMQPMGLHLYNYYRDHLAKIICIAPTRQNFYLQCFLPMAHKHKGILYGILAWSAHHLSISTNVQPLDESQPSTMILDKDSQYSKLANKYTLKSLQCLHEPQQQSNSSFLFSLAQILVLCGAEICQGDVIRWQILLKTGAKLIEEHLGDSNLISLLTDNNNSRFDAIDLMTRNWLVANFIYHDIMGSKTTKFPMNQYEALLISSNQSFIDWNLHVDPLHGLNRPIFKVLGETTNLIRQIKAEKFNSASPNFNSVMVDALELNQQLLNIKPNENELMILSHCTDEYDDEFDYRKVSEQLFEVFRISALIHLKTNVLKVEKNTFELSYYNKKLLTNLDLVLGTKLESSLCFPMFICGINCVDKDRDLIEKKFMRFISTYKCRNVVRARDIMLKVWKMDDDGESLGSSGIRERDWIDICDDIGWDISFA